jgi:hypothetical protein
VEWSWALVEASGAGIRARPVAGGGIRPERACEGEDGSAGLAGGRDLFLLGDC